LLRTMTSSGVSSNLQTFTAANGEGRKKLIPLTRVGGKADRRRLRRAEFAAHLVPPVPIGALRTVLCAIWAVDSDAGICRIVPCGA
jgi:hypothetical protein